MTHISRDDVAALATMSSLQLADDELDNLRGDLEAILGYVEQLGELDTTGVEPTYQVTGLENVMRGDEVEHDVAQEDLLALAPLSKDNQIQVPKVL